MTESDPWTDEAREMVRRLGRLPAPVADAMRAVPRHEFVGGEWRRAAYDDEPLPLPGSDSTISAPHMVAFQLEWAELSEGRRVLEVGAGLGYLAALIGQLVGPTGRVIALELNAGLARDGARRLQRLGYADRVELREGDGWAGAPDDAPFDRILVSCAAPEIAPAWKAHLRDGGTIVAPIGDAWEQVMVRYRKVGSGGTREEGPRCRFVALKTRSFPHI